MAAATAARVMGTAGALYHANTLTSSFLLRPFSISHKAVRLNRNLNAPARLFTCRALYRPEAQIKEEGQPETLDYRVFFVDQSGKKVLIRLYFSYSAKAPNNSCAELIQILDFLERFCFFKLKMCRRQQVLLMIKTPDSISKSCKFYVSNSLIISNSISYCKTFWNIFLIELLKQIPAIELLKHL